ncbi:MAG: 30S ribosomal protein S27ae [Promethearchaeota archaeon]|nr:MAG: 30S ribosomal protein S27ae [Candidatus Lokiarchaeota archaeon]
MTDASKYYKIEGDQLVRTHRTCPKCGTGYFLADHYDRWSCGKCGYTIFKRKGKKGASVAGSRGSKKRSPRKRTKSM